MACRNIWGWGLKPSPAVSPARSIMRAKPAVVKGEPRSLVKTNGEDGSCSREADAAPAARRRGSDGSQAVMGRGL